MSVFHDVTELPERELAKGFHARMVHGEGMTVAHWRVEAGAELPMHAHPHEMIVNLLEGELEITVGQEKRVLHAGGIAVIPGNVPHGVTARTACRILDVWHPVREDYKAKG
ncbi:MAG TPA: cupin domain-containing protein [bacterium]|nr:cupin domain-containing protein [bacterium]